TQDVAKSCVVFLIDVNNIKEKDCGSENIAVSIKLVTSEPTKLFNNGWSKRFAGYDPNDFTQSPDGSINITDFYTIIFKK
ncbi:MAG TPA: hypothetical protein VHZ50_06130, partial [Puia sp.]|nr:hypothetical protein [Puia sp.]